MRYLFTLSLAFILLSCSDKGIIIKVENPVDTDRSEEMVELRIDQLRETLQIKNGETFIVRNSEGEQIPSQLTYDGKLIFQCGLVSAGSTTFNISSGKPGKYAQRTYGRHIPERKDDFAWENDRVAFRIYGPALLPVDGPSNGIDLWYKKTADMIIDKWYADDISGKASYHVDHGEGFDNYKVGRSLGGGAMAPFINENLVLNGNYSEQELLECGPLRTTFKVTYPDLEINGKPVGESRTFSIDAGSQLTKIVQQYTTDEPFKVAAGISNRGNEEYISGQCFLVYREHESVGHGGVYVGLVFPEDYERIAFDSYTIGEGKNKTEYVHLLAITTYDPAKPVTYYTGYGWSKYGYEDIEEFEEYLSDFVENLRNPLIITF